LPFEIGLLATGCDYFAAVTIQTAHDCRADHAAVARYVNSLAGKIKDLIGHQIDFS
jgi:hypothetical protein